MKEEKKTFAEAAKKINVKEIIRQAKASGNIKPHTEAFEKIPVEKESHKGKISYFVN